MGPGFDHRVRDHHHRPWRWLVLATMALLLVFTSAESVLSDVVVSEAAHPGPDSGDAYCRVRRDVRSDWQPILSSAVGPSVGLIVPPGAAPRIVPRSDRAPIPSTEHQSTLARRTRAPGPPDRAAR